MKYAVQKSNLKKLIGQRNGYLVLSAGMLLLCLLLSMMVLRLIGRERTIIVPPVVHSSFWVDHNEVSPEYLSEMTTFFSQLRLTLNPSNAAYQRETLLRYTDPSYYGALKNELVAEEDHLAASHISLAFYPVNIKVDTKNLIAFITGDLQSNVGNDPLPTERVSYKVSYRYDQGRLLLKSFSEAQEMVEERPREQKRPTASPESSSTQSKPQNPLGKSPVANIDKAGSISDPAVSSGSDAPARQTIAETEQQIVKTSIGPNDAQPKAAIVPPSITSLPTEQPQENPHV